MKQSFKSGLTRREMLHSLAASLPVLAMPGLLRAAEDAPRYGGTFVVASSSEPRHLNMNITTDSVPKLIVNPVYSKLIGLKGDLTHKADLAKTWSISDDGLEFVFNLHEGVRWHDGAPFTAADVKFSFEKVLFDAHATGRTLASHVAEIATPDDHTVIFRLVAPNDVLITFIAQQGFIQPKHLFEGTDFMQNPASMAPVGTGAFRFVRWESGQEIVLERNPDYFLADRPYVDRIVTRFIPEASARMRALQAGEVDYVTYFDVPASFVEEMQKDGRVVVANQGHEAWGSLVQLMPNHDNPILAKPEVRKALAHAVDRDFIIRAAVYGLAKPATGPISSQIAWAYTPDTTQYPLDIDRANALLDEAGHPRDANGIRFKLNIVTNRGTDTFVKVAQVLVEQFKPIGIEVELRPLDNAASLETVFVKREFDLYVASFTTGPDPALGVHRQYLSSNIRPVPTTNSTAYRSEKADALLARAAASGDREERKQIYTEFSRLACDDCVMVWLYENPTFSIFNAGFGNMHSWAAESNYAYNDVYWKEGTETRT